MCLARPVSNNFRCFTVNSLQVLCLTDCGPLLPARGLDNCHWWVFGTNKVSVVWAFWLSGASNPKETVTTAWLLEKGHSGKVADIRRGGGLRVYTQACIRLYTVLEHKHASSNMHSHTYTHQMRVAVILRLMKWQNSQAPSAMICPCIYCVTPVIHKITCNQCEMYSNIILLIWGVLEIKRQKEAVLPSEVFLSKSLIPLCSMTVTSDLSVEQSDRKTDFPRIIQSRGVVHPVFLRGNSSQPLEWHVKICLQAEHGSD